MSQVVFVPLTDDMLEIALQEEHPQLIPYSYQQTCYRGLDDNCGSEPGKGSISEPALSNKSGGYGG